MADHRVVRYSIVRILRDAINGEFVNAGVVVLDGDVVHRRWLTDWSRATAFLGDVSWFTDRISDIEDTMTRQDVEWMAANSDNSVQYTSLMPSLEEPEKLADWLADRFLVEQVKDAA